MGAEVHLMNICTVFGSSAFNGLLCYNSPTSATLDRYAPCLSSLFQFEFRDEKQKEFSQRIYFISDISIILICSLLKTTILSSGVDLFSNLF